MNILKCRRTTLALFAIACLTFLGWARAAEVAAAISTIVLAVAASNASQAILKKKDKTDGE